MGTDDDSELEGQPSVESQKQSVRATLIEKNRQLGGKLLKQMQGTGGWDGGALVFRSCVEDTQEALGGAGVDLNLGLVLIPAQSALALLREPTEDSQKSLQHTFVAVNSDASFRVWQMRYGESVHTAKEELRAETEAAQKRYLPQALDIVRSQ